MTGLVRVYSYPRDRKALAQVFASAAESDPRVLDSVSRIIEEVRRGGNRALCRLTKKFDGIDLRPAQLAVKESALKSAWDSLAPALRRSLRLAARRIEAFHRRQRRATWSMTDKEGLRLTQRWLPLERVGVYVPGGTAAYPSTVLMNVIPARVAGVSEIVAVTPPEKAGLYNAATLGALYLCGVTEVYRVGGAQAVAALAYGTETLRRVDKVVGPGNRYVAAAKRLLYGVIDIDAIAGPSEVMIVADRTAPVAYVAADLLAQAEHDEAAQAIAVLVGTGWTRARIAVLQEEIAAQTASAPRGRIIRRSLRARGAIVAVKDIDTAVELANEKAPEHLELMTRDARALAGRMRNAGSIFVGRYTPEALGDYVAGPNHVLPTGGTARFASALSVDDFVRMTQVIEAGEKELSRLALPTVTLAEAEGLHAHAQTVKKRVE